MVKMSVSKTEVGGSSPPSPAFYFEKFKKYKNFNIVLQ